MQNKSLSDDINTFVDFWLNYTFNEGDEGIMIVVYSLALVLLVTGYTMLFFMLLGGWQMFTHTKWDVLLYFIYCLVWIVQFVLSEIISGGSVAIFRDDNSDYYFDT